MALTGKVEPKELCKHLKAVMQAMIDNKIEMSHDFSGTWLYCNKHGKGIHLEAYEDKIKKSDMLEMKS